MKGFPMNHFEGPWLGHNQIIPLFIIYSSSGSHAIEGIPFIYSIRILTFHTSWVQRLHKTTNPLQGCSPLLVNSVLPIVYHTVNVWYSVYLFTIPYVYSMLPIIHGIVLIFHILHLAISNSVISCFGEVYIYLFPLYDHIIQYVTNNSFALQ